MAVPAFNKDGSFNSKAFDENGTAMPWAIPSYKDGKPKGAILTGREGKHGYDCRRLFYVPKGWRLVGCDLSGIELRCLANLTAPHDGGFLINQILDVTSTKLTVRLLVLILEIKQRRSFMLALILTQRLTPDLV